MAQSLQNYIDKPQVVHYICKDLRANFLREENQLNKSSPKVKFSAI